MPALVMELEVTATSFCQPVTICHTLTRHFISPVSFITANRRFEVTIAFIHTKFCQFDTLIRTKFCQFDTLIRTKFRAHHPSFSGIAYHIFKDYPKCHVQKTPKFVREKPVLTIHKCNSLCIVRSYHLCRLILFHEPVLMFIKSRF